MELKKMVSKGSRLRSLRSRRGGMDGEGGSQQRCGWEGGCKKEDQAVNDSSNSRLIKRATVNHTRG
jgi:hypothetical protein